MLLSEGLAATFFQMERPGSMMIDVQLTSQFLFVGSQTNLPTSPVGRICVSMNLVRAHGYLQAVLPRQILSQAREANRALYANLANALLTRSYAKLLIPRLGDVVQLVRTLPCHGRGREFESRRPRHSFSESSTVQQPGKTCHFLGRIQVT